MNDDQVALPLWFEVFIKLLLLSAIVALIFIGTMCYALYHVKDTNFTSGQAVLEVDSQEGWVEMQEVR